MLDASLGCQVLLEVGRGDANRDDLAGTAKRPRLFAVDGHRERRGVSRRQDDRSSHFECDTLAGLEFARDDAFAVTAGIGALVGTVA